MKKAIVAFVVKEADEYGIRIVNAEWSEDNANWISFWTEDSNFKQYAVGNDWFRTEDEARTQIERMRAWRIEIKETELQTLKDKVYGVQVARQ